VDAAEVVVSIVLAELVQVFDQLSHAKIMVISCLNIIKKFTRHYLP
jgi:hypothetical protein